LRVKIRSKCRRADILLSTSVLLGAVLGAALPAQQRPSDRRVSAALPEVGGEKALKLERKATSRGQKLEFLAVTLLPGRAMNMFQITANLPGKGEVELLDSPLIQVAAQRLTGEAEDVNGNRSFSFGGAFLIPFSSRISGTLSPDGKTLATSWRGHTLTLPVNSNGKYSVHGLIHRDKAEDLKTVTTADGQTETALVHAGNFGGHWLSNTDVYFTVALSGPALDITIIAKNAGNQAEPMAIGWHPYFKIPSGDRAQARLHIPASRTAAVDKIDARTTGEFKPVEGTEFDYRSPEGVALDDHARNINFSDLIRTDGAVDAWLTDPKANYGLHVKALSPHIHTIQVYSPVDRSFAAIEEQFNYPDPWGPEWKGMDTGMVPLEPGQSVTWKVRLELFSPNAGK
jgi:aldose 1-epimerase